MLSNTQGTFENLSESYKYAHQKAMEIDPSYIEPILFMDKLNNDTGTFDIYYFKTEEDLLIMRLTGRPKEGTYEKEHFENPRYF